MTPARHTISKLRGALLGSLGAAILAGALVTWSWMALQQARQARAIEYKRQHQSEQRLQHVGSEAHELAERAEVFRQLQTAGIAGEGNRLAWTETLQAIRDELQIPGLVYEFSAQARLDAAADGAPLWVGSTLHLRTRLLHEDDLLRLLARIETEAGALPLLHSCHLERHSAATAEHLLNSACEMTWINLQPGAPSP